MRETTLCYRDKNGNKRVRRKTALRFFRGKSIRQLRDTVAYLRGSAEDSYYSEILDIVLTILKDRYSRRCRGRNR